MAFFLIILHLFLFSLNSNFSLSFFYSIRANSFLHSTGGMRWGRDNIKNFHVNMCTYYAKGSAHYVGIWDFDEFFLPRGNNKNLPDVLQAMGDPKGITENFHPKNMSILDIQSFWKKGRGLADGRGHPYCYLLLSSEVTNMNSDGKNTDPTRVSTLFARHFYFFHFSFFIYYALFVYIFICCSFPPPCNQ